MKNDLRSDFLSPIRYDSPMHMTHIRGKIEKSRAVLSYASTTTTTTSPTRRSEAGTIAPQPQPDRDRSGHNGEPGDGPEGFLPSNQLNGASPITSYLRRAAAAAVPRRRTKTKVRYGPLLRPLLAFTATPTGPCTPPPDDFRGE
uniref:Uncharacterized protein n=1 Tax=Anopheles farauti TaxID=69004 RepID=A0A182QYC8_9DIPT